MLKGNRPWYIVLGLSIIGLADATYLLLFQTNKIESLVCPVFGGGCEQVSSSAVAYPAGIPDAIFGVAGYALAALTAAGIIFTRGRTRRWLAMMVMVGTLGAAGLSAFLTYAQPTKTGAWCFWCLTSAVIAVTMAPIAFAGGRRILRGEDEQPQETVQRAAS